MINTLNHWEELPNSALYPRATELTKLKFLLSFAQKAQIDQLRHGNVFLDLAGCLGLVKRRLHGRVGGAAIAAHGLHDQLITFFGLLAVKLPKTLREVGHLFRLLADKDQCLDDCAHHFLDLVRPFFNAPLTGTEDAEKTVLHEVSGKNQQTIS